jgi:Tat protein secretion system quality control protein TatD with DNase activity
MCGEDNDAASLSEDSSSTKGKPSDDFPWHLGVIDAHNHIGERMLTIRDIPDMRSRCLAIMATRSQDQPLVAFIASSGSLALTHADQLRHEDSTTVVPGFGRHPWFSHELYDDLAEKPTFDIELAKRDMNEAKMRHYAAVLTPTPLDVAFVADLPAPEPLTQFIKDTRERLRRFPLAMVGEIGLDKGFRLPGPWTVETKAAIDPARTPGGRQRRPLSRINIAMEHQKAVLMAQLRLAGEMGRAVSVHGVQVHGTLFDILVSCWKGYERKKVKKTQKDKSNKQGDIDAILDGTSNGRLPYPPRICLHSFSGKSEGVRQYLNPKFPADVFFSFSKTNNLRDDAGRSKMEDALKMVPDDRLLVESDIHTAGDQMDAELEMTYRAICAMKGWDLEHGVRQIARNWANFVFG